jgi:hypothetical protein
MRGDVTDSGIMRVLSKICDIVCLFCGLFAHCRSLRSEHRQQRCIQ